MHAHLRRLRRYLTGATVLPLFLLAGCGDTQPSGAVGPNDELSFFTNQPREGRVSQEVRRVLEYRIDVVTRELAFRVDLVPWSDFRVHRQVKNQVFAVDLSRRDPLADDVRGWLTARAPERMAAKKPFHLIVHDQFAVGQSTLYLAGWSPDDLVGLLAGADSTVIRGEFEQSVVRGLTHTMFAMGEETDLPRQMEREFGWTLRLPTGFNAAGDPDGNFVKFNAEEPVRLILLHWEEGEVPLEPEAWESRMGRILRVYNDGDYIQADRTEVHAARFQGVPALRWEGLWQNDKYVIGGPFRAIAFRTATRSWILIGMVYNPGGDKVAPLRQTEAVINTFREVP